MRWGLAVLSLPSDVNQALTDALPSVMLGPVETDTAVAFREHIRQGEAGKWQ
jgi:hypothetical protein